MAKELKWIPDSDGWNLSAVIRKFGNWDVGFIKYSGNPKVYLMVRGLWYGENPIIYKHNLNVAYDYPERIPARVKEYIYKNAARIYNTQKRLNNASLMSAGIPDYMSGYM